MTRCDNSKKSSFGQPSAFGRSPAKILSNVRRFTPKKCSCRTAFGCLSTPTAKLPRRPAAIARKSATQDCLRLWIYTEQKASPAFGDVPQKNVHAGQPSAAFFPPTARLPRRPAAIARKRVAPDSLRLWIYTEQKVPPSFGDLPRKNVHAGLPSAAFPNRPRGLSSGPLR